MSDWGGFWDRLAVDWVVALVGGFVLQGFWFTLIHATGEFNPALQTTLESITPKLFIPWALLILAGMTWGVLRAVEARDRPR